jgi:hypothetical protein
MSNTTFSGPVRSQNGFQTVSVNSTTGAVSTTMTLSASLVGFYGVTPVAQPSTTGTTTGFTAGAGTAVLSDSTFTGNTGTAAYTIGDVVKALKDLGLLAA